MNLNILRIRIRQLALQFGYLSIFARTLYLYAICAVYNFRVLLLQRKYHRPRDVTLGAVHDPHRGRDAAPEYRPATSYDSNVYAALRMESEARER